MSERDREKAYNIEDYLKWRGDIPLSADPFNDVDNLVLCELTYSYFDGIIPEGGSAGIAEIRDRFFETHSREELRKDGGFMALAPLLMDGIVSGSRFGNMTVSSYLNVIDTGADAQIAAMTFLLDDGTAYVSFRGTDNTVVGWKEDFNLSYLTETEGQRRAVLYLTEAASMTERPLRVGGHSKGGNFAVYASAFAGESIQDRIIGIYTNDGPGLRKEVTNTDGYRRMIPKVTSIVPETSIIGQLLRHDFPDIVVKSSELGLKQHNGFTWCVERNRFVPSELSELGRFFRRTHADWLSKLDDDVREAFVSTLFDIIETAEADTFKELREQKRESAEKILQSVRNLPRNQQLNMLRVIEELIISGSDTAKDLLSGILSGGIWQDDDERQH